MMAETLAGIALAALCTYLLHSTCLLGLAWLVADRLTSLRSQEWAWRTALLGGLLTTTLQLGLSVEPWAGHIPLEAHAESSSVEVAREPAITRLASVVPVSTAPSIPVEPRLESGVSMPGWKPVVLWIWALGGLIAALGFLMAMARLKLHLTRRSRVEGGSLQAQFACLEPNFRIAPYVRLFTSKRVQAPMAHGWLRPSITVPTAALGLPPEEQRALLAHELSHLQRGDPAWLTLARLLEIALFVQPLNRIAQRRLSALAEFQCDAAALRATEDRVALARCLTEVAGWIVGHQQPLPACHMADYRSPLAARVCRILEAPTHRERAPIGTAIATTAALIAVACAAPGAAAPAATLAMTTDANTALETATQPTVQPAKVRVPALEALIASLRIERQALDRDLRVVADRLADHSPSPQWLARLGKIEDRVSLMDVRIVQLENLVARLKARNAATRQTRRFNSQR